jgi:hypothetical protein
MFDESRFKESQVEYVIEVSSLENIDECIDKDDNNNSQRMDIDGKSRLHGEVCSDVLLRV